MNKILVVVDDTKTSKAVVATFQNMAWKPRCVILLHVERLQGNSLIIDMLSDSELNTLKESLKGSEHQEKLDRKAEKILTYYKKELETDGSFSITRMIRAGKPADEILKVAEEESVDLILLGSNGLKGINRVFTGSIASEVEKRSKIPVLVAKMPMMCEEPYSWRDAYAAITITMLVVLCLFIIGAVL
jgi:nucleotide-binding universal stress UspA family protein